MLFRFYCDESYDGCPPDKARRNRALPAHKPRTYVVAGFFADQLTWDDVETRWDAVTKRFNVPRFHAAHLNSKTHEYDGWDDEQKIAYSEALLNVVASHGPRLHIFTCGMLADKYREVISEEGRIKLGHPYLVCFKTCLALIVGEMEQGGFPPGDQIEVVFDQNKKFQNRALELFNNLKINPHFPHRHRLASCRHADSSRVTCLQPADMVAYETFKRLHANRDNPNSEMRKVFNILVHKNGYDGGNYFSERILREFKPRIESAVCDPDELVILPT